MSVDTARSIRGVALRRRPFGPPIRASRERSLPTEYGPAARPSPGAAICEYQSDSSSKRPTPSVALVSLECRPHAPPQIGAGSGLLTPVVPYQPHVEVVAPGTGAALDAQHGALAGLAGQEGDRQRRGRGNTLDLPGQRLSFAAPHGGAPATGAESTSGNHCQKWPGPRGILPRRGIVRRPHAREQAPNGHHRMVQHLLSRTTEEPQRAAPAAVRATRAPRNPCELASYPLC
jgi:hypothetical protein